MAWNHHVFTVSPNINSPAERGHTRQNKTQELTHEPFEVH